MHFSTWAQCFNCKSCLYLVKVKFRLKFFNLRYSSQILKHLGDFPLPQCWFGYYSHLSGPKYMWLNIGEGEGHIWVRTKVRRMNAIHFRKNWRKTVSVSTICDADCKLILNFLSLIALNILYQFNIFYTGTKTNCTKVQIELQHIHAKQFSKL